MTSRRARELTTRSYNDGPLVPLEAMFTLYTVASHTSDGTDSSFVHVE